MSIFCWGAAERLAQGVVLSLLLRLLVLVSLSWPLPAGVEPLRLGLPEILVNPTMHRLQLTPPKKTYGVTLTTYFKTKTKNELKDILSEVIFRHCWSLGSGIVCF